MYGDEKYDVWRYTSSVFCKAGGFLESTLKKRMILNAYLSQGEIKRMTLALYLLSTKFVTQEKIKKEYPEPECHL